MATVGAKKAAANIFSLPKHAHFLGAAASAASIPKLYGAPEASEGRWVSCPRLLMIHTGHFDWTRERRQIVSPERSSRSQVLSSYKQETGMDSPLEIFVCFAQLGHAGSHEDPQLLPSRQGTG